MQVETTQLMKRYRFAMAIHTGQYEGFDMIDQLHCMFNKLI